MDIEAIKIGHRHRRDLGDIDGLAASIAEIGLLHPPVVTPDGKLIAGERRIMAYRKLGRTDIPVTVVDLAEIVRGEFAENAERKNFLPSEIEAIRRAMEPFERAAAKARMAQGGGDRRSADRVCKVDTPDIGRTRHKIGAFSGVSGVTLDKITKVVRAAEAEPERFGSLVDEMDRTGRVDPAYRKVLAAEKAAALDAARAAHAAALKQSDDANRAWNLWLECKDAATIAGELNRPIDVVDAWITERLTNPVFRQPPGATPDREWGDIQHFDVWNFPRADGDSAYFGRMPPQLVRNLLWLYTSPGQIVVDPFAGGGTTIDVAKQMGRRVWVSDLVPSTPNLPIHQHDIGAGWPVDAPDKADLILLDPPYWQQAKGRYSDRPEDLANVSLEEFYGKWSAIIAMCREHLADGGKLAYIIGPTVFTENWRTLDHAADMMVACRAAGLVIERRIIVPYQTQQATGQQVTWAREKKRLLNLYRDLVVWIADSAAAS